MTSPRHYRRRRRRWPAGGRGWSLNNQLKNRGKERRHEVATGHREERKRVRGEERPSLKRPTHTMPGRPYRYIHVHDAAWRHRIVKRASIVVTIVSLRHYSKTIVQHNETYGRMSRESSPLLSLALSSPDPSSILPDFFSFFICFSYSRMKFCSVMSEGEGREEGDGRFYTASFANEQREEQSTPARGKSLST